MQTPDTGNIRNGHSRKRGAKNGLRGGYPFLKHRFSTRETFTGITAQMAERLRCELQEFYGRDFPAVDPANPTESVRQLYKATAETDREAYRITLAGDGLHLHSMESVASAGEFHMMPIAFTFKLKEPFATLTRRFLRRIVSAYGMTDIRDTYYFEISHEFLEEDDDLDPDDDPDYYEQRQRERAEFNNYVSGQKGDILDAFNALEPVTFEELKSYTPSDGERDLYDIMLQAEKVLKDAPVFSHHSLSSHMYLRDDTWPDDIVIIDNTLTYTYDNNDDEIVDTIDSYINNDFDNGCTEDEIISDVTLSASVPEDGLTDKLTAMRNYLFELYRTIRAYE